MFVSKSLALDHTPMSYASKSASHLHARRLTDSIIYTMKHPNTPPNPFLSLGEDGEVKVHKSAPSAIRILSSRRKDLGLSTDVVGCVYLLNSLTSVPLKDPESLETVRSCYEEVFNACSKMRDGVNAVSVYEGMVGSGVEGNTRTINGAVTAMARGGRYEDAKEALGRIEVLDSYGKVAGCRVARGLGEVEMARGILEGWEGEIKEGKKEGWRGIFVGYSIFVDLVKGGGWEGIERVLERAKVLQGGVVEEDEAMERMEDREIEPELTNTERKRGRGVGKKRGVQGLAMSYAGVLAPSVLAAGDLGMWDKVEDIVEEIEGREFVLASVYGHACKAVIKGGEKGGFTTAQGTELIGRIFGRCLELYQGGKFDRSSKRAYEVETAFHGVAEYAVGNSGGEGGRDVARWAMGWMESMIKAGVRPNMSGYSMIMQVLGNAGEGKTAWEMLLEEARADAREKEAGGRQGWVVTNVYSWNAVIKGCVNDNEKGGPDVKRAEEVFEAMNEFQKRDGHSWYHVMQVMERAGEAGTAMKYLDRMIREGRSRNASNPRPDFRHFDVVFGAIERGMEEGDGIRAEEYVNMVAKILGQGLMVLRGEDYYKVMGRAAETLTKAGRGGEAGRVLMNVVRMAEQKKHLKVGIEEAAVRAVKACRKSGGCVKEAVEGGMEEAGEMGIERNMEIYRAATASVAEEGGREGYKGEGEESWLYRVYGDAVERGVLPGMEVEGDVKGLIDLHRCNVPLAVGGLCWAAETADEKGLKELVVVTGNGRDDGEGVRNAVVNTLKKAGCEGLYTMDKMQNGKNKGRIGMVGEMAIQEVAKSLKDLRE